MSFLWDIGKQCRARSDAVIRISTDKDKNVLYIFEYKIEKYHPTTLKIEMDWTKVSVVVGGGGGGHRHFGSVMKKRSPLQPPETFTFLQFLI